MSPVTPRTTTSGSTRYDGITFAEIVGFRPLLLDLHVPETPNPPPLVVWIHGGGFQTGDRRELPDTLAPESIFDALGAAGIACATIDYRLSGEAIFPAQIDDVITAIDYLHQHASELGFDGQRIGTWGESAGGALAALAGLQDRRVSAVVAWYALTDARLDRSPEGIDVLRRLFGAAPVDAPELAGRASAVTHVTAAAPPFLLIHGDADTTVPLIQSELLHQRLIEAGARSTLQLVPGAEHCFVGYADAAGLVDDSVAFFSAELRSR